MISRLPTLVLTALVVVPGCRETTTPTQPTSISVTPTPGTPTTSSNTNNNDNNVDVQIIITFPPAPTPPPCCEVPTPVPTPTPTPPSGQIRTPDPPFGSSLPLPSYTPAVVQEVQAANPQLILSSCIAQFGLPGWQFMDKMVDRLRLNDTRWGYACGLDCNNPSGELLAYHATAGPDVMGAQGIITVDIIDSYCVSPAVGFLNRGFDAVGRWSTRNRF